MTVVTLYEANETTFNHNGLGVLHELTEYRITEVLNGEFEGVFDYPVSGHLYDQIEDHMFIKAKPNRVDEPHVFRIYETELDIERQSLLIYVRSNIYDLASNLVRHTGVNNLTPDEAWRNAVSAAIDPVDVTFHTDITTPSSITWTRRNLLSCIVGEQGSMLQIWGGELKYGNKWIWLWRRRGDDNVTTIRYGKNLAGLKSTYSTKGLVTAILPYFTYRPDSEGDETQTAEEEIVTGQIVKSELVGAYPYTHYDAVEFTEEDGVTDLESLNRVASRYFKDHPDKDKPTINMEINLLDLSHTKEYEKFKGLEEVKLGDTITVYAGPFNVDVTAKVTKIEYNGLTDENEVIEVGATRASQYENYRDLVQNEVDKNLGEVNKRLNLVQIAANGKNKIFRGPDEPTGHLRVGDLWFKPLGDGHMEIYQWNGWTWGDPIISTKNLEVAQEAIDEAKKNLEAFEKNWKAIQDRNDQELEEFENNLADIRQEIDKLSELGITPEQIEEALAKVGFDRQQIEAINDDINTLSEEVKKSLESAGFNRQQIKDISASLAKTSDSADLALEMIGRDGKTRYNRNRLDGPTNRQQPFGTQPISGLGHNGDGFIPGESYTISFEALCEALEQLKLVVGFDYPTQIGKDLTIRLVPNHDLLPTIERTVQNKLEQNVYLYPYNLTVSSNWYQTIQVQVDVSKQASHQVQLVLKDLFEADLTSDDVIEWAEQPQIIYEGGIWWQTALKAGSL